MKKLQLLIALILVTVLNSCVDKNDYMVIIHTQYGDMKAILYNETPLHKQNFLTLAKDGRYDSTKWHRIIEDFMIQGGNIYDKEGTQEPEGARIPAEIVEGFMHTKGALAAARQSDQVNPEKMSSSSQFYIVDGKVFSEQEMTTDEFQLNMGINQLLQKPEYDSLYQRFVEVTKERDPAKIQQLAFQCVDLVEEELGISLKKEVSPEALEAYTTLGGSPHLDGEYTVFGRIVEGIDVIDQLAAVKKDRSDRPIEDIFLTMEVVKVPKKEITEKYGYVYPTE
jgi:peptidyl-prolyl cis-trans isomerase B (cyclophilin B)